MFDYYTRYIQLNNKLADMGKGAEYSKEGCDIKDQLSYLYSKMTDLEKTKANFMVKKIALDKEIEKDVQLSENKN